MIKNSWILYLFVLLTASSSVFSQKQVEQAVDAPQNWQNGMEHFCRNNNETFPAFQVRINTRMRDLGNGGWELVSVSSAPLVEAWIA